MFQKQRFILSVAVLATLLCSAAMLTASDNSLMSRKAQSLTLQQPALVGGTLLPAGTYKITHQMDGQTHIMIFKQVGGTAEVKAKCNLVPLDKKAAQDKQYFEEAKNQRVLIEMTFKGDTVTHVLQP